PRLRDAARPARAHPRRPRHGPRAERALRRVASGGGGAVGALGGTLVAGQAVRGKSTASRNCLGISRAPYFLRSGEKSAFWAIPRALAYAGRPPDDVGRRGRPPRCRVAVTRAYSIG